MIRKLSILSIVVAAFLVVTASMAAVYLIPRHYSSPPAVQSASNSALGKESQQPGPTPSLDTKATTDRVVGEITAVDSGNKQLTLRTTAGRVFSVKTDEKTQYRRVPPGETTLEKGSVIAFADIGVGDKTIVKGKMVDNNVAAQALIVVSAQELKQKQMHDRAEWKKRGIQGTIVGMNPGTKALMVRIMTPNGPAPLHITTEGKKVRYLRFGPNAVKLSDAKPSSYDEIAFGDQIRALGDRSPDGMNFLPEEIISGSFQMVGGTITEVNQETGEVKITNVKTKQPFTIIISKDSKLRRIPPELLKRMEQTMAAAPAPAPGGMRIIRPGEQAPGEGQTPAGPRVMMPGQGPGGGAAPAPAVDYGEAIENLPPITIGDLKPGDGIIVSSTKGTDPARGTAVLLAAGLESFIKRQEANPKGPAFPLDLALPGVGGP